MKLQNKVAIITGAASGIGLATANFFAQEGAHVVVADLNESKAHSVSQNIEIAHHNKTLAMRCDDKIEDSKFKIQNCRTCVTCAACNVTTDFNWAAQTPSNARLKQTQ